MDPWPQMGMRLSAILPMPGPFSFKPVATRATADNHLRVVIPRAQLAARGSYKKLVLQLQSTARDQVLNQMKLQWELLSLFVFAFDGLSQSERKVSSLDPLVTSATVRFACFAT